MRRGVCYTLLLLVPLLAWVSPAVAVSKGLELHINGFATAGIAFSDSDNLGFRSDSSQRYIALDGEAQYRNDSLAGLQLGVQFNEQFSAAVQAKAKYRVGGLESFISMAYLSYQPNPSLQLRAGRLPVDVFLLGESRDVGVSRLWVRPVEEFYGTVLLDALDGADLSYSLPYWRGVLNFRLAGGTIRQRNALSEDWHAVMMYDPFWSLNLEYVMGDWRFRFGYMEAKVSEFEHVGFDNVLRDIVAHLSQLPADFLYELEAVQTTDVTLSHTAFGVSYDRGAWRVAAEFAQPDYQQYGWNGYLSVGYRIGNLTPYAVIGRAYSEKRNLLTTKNQLSAAMRERYNYLIQLTDGGINQTSFTVGARWGISDNMALKLQAAHRRVGEGGAILWLDQPSLPLDTRVNTVSLALDFTF